MLLRWTSEWNPWLFCIESFKIKEVCFCTCSDPSLFTGRQSHRLGPKHCLEELWTYIPWMSFPYSPFSSAVVPHLRQTNDSSTSFCSASSSGSCWAKPEAVFHAKWDMKCSASAPGAPFPSILLSCLKPKDGLGATLEMPVLTVPTAAAGASLQTAQKVENSPDRVQEGESKHAWGGFFFAFSSRALVTADQVTLFLKWVDRLVGCLIN